MIRGVLAKSRHEVLLPTVTFAAAMFMFNMLLAFILPQIRAGMGQVLGAMPFVRTIVQAMTGVELGETIGAEVMQSIAWVHPVILTTVWAYEIVLCTRYPVGEVARGTIDVLMSWPVSRRGVYWTELAVCCAGGFVLLLTGLAGQDVGTRLMGEKATPLLDVGAWTVLLNLYCVFLAVAGIAGLASALSTHRAWAAGIVGAFVMSSFLWNFLGQFWEPAKRLAFLGVMHYYQPARVFMNGEWPWRNMAVLLAAAAICASLGAEVTARRRL